MPRYIDAEYLIQKINDNRELSRWAKDLTISCVMDTPVLDVSEIVRCGSCRYAIKSEEKLMCSMYCDCHNEDHFCAIGKKKQGA